MPKGMKVPEKTKDFKGTMIRLFKNLDKFRKLLIVSLLLAFLSSVLSAIAPNKLSDVTNVISDGIKPNVEMFKTIWRLFFVGEVGNNFGACTLSVVIVFIVQSINAAYRQRNWA